MTKYSLLFITLLQGISSVAIASPHVDIQTNKGTITLELNPTEAPLTVANFLSYVDTGFYDKTLFHRVIKKFMIQGGGLDTNSVEKETLAPIKIESDNNLKNLRGTIAMARTSAPDSATSQFFINTVDNDFLNYQENKNDGHAVFGKVTQGMDVVDSISTVATTGRNAVPVEKVIIETIRPREGELSFKGLQPSYTTGDIIDISLEESGIKRDKAMDLWVAILLPNGTFLYLNKEDNFTPKISLFKSAVAVQETSHTVLHFVVPEGIKGHYSFFAIFNKNNTDISDLTHSLRSNIAHSETDL